MLTPRQAFKVAFLRRCADQGLTLDETRAVVKQATERVKTAGLGEALTKPYEKSLDVAGDVVGSVGQRLGGLGLGALLLGPAVVGGLAGYGAARLTDVDDTDVDAIKSRELIDEYYRQIDKIKARRKGVFGKPHPSIGPT